MDCLQLLSACNKDEIKMIVARISHILIRIEIWRGKESIILSSSSYYKYLSYEGINRQLTMEIHFA